MRPGRLFTNRVRPFDPASVTTIGPEDDPRAGGVDGAAVARIWQAVVDYYRMGLQPAMALCIRRRGAVILNRTIGHAQGNEPGSTGEPVLATPETLFNLFSASKCVVAMLIHLLDDQGVLHLDDPVVAYIPEFGQHGKQHITLRHILTHRAGIPLVIPDATTIETLQDPERILALICGARPLSAAGRRQAYHALNGGFILGEIIQRVSGRDIQTLLRASISEPLGLKHFRYGVEEQDLHRVAREAFTGPRPRPPGSWLLKRSLGIPIARAVDLANDPRFLTSVVPSGNLIATADEVSRFFELLLREGTLGGVPIFTPRTVRRAVAEYRFHALDGVMMLPVRYGLGFMLGGERVSFYGPGTPRAFGHLGFTNVLAYADPERDISVAFLNNGKPFVTPELVLWMRVMWVIGATLPREIHPAP